MIVFFFLYNRRAANAARAMAALTSSTMSGVFPPIAAAMPMIPPMSSVPPMLQSKGMFYLRLRSIDFFLFNFPEKSTVSKYFQQSV